jgi:hypothetical protein
VAVLKKCSKLMEAGARGLKGLEREERERPYISLTGR